MKLSVIVCTRNRAHAIIPCLDSIAASLARAAPVDAEIVVIDNASEDNTSAVVRAWASSSAFPVRLRFEPKKGAGAARNCGLRAAQGDLLVWTDDDCRLDKDHIRDALRRDAADADPVLRGGRVELGDPADLPLTIKTERALRRWSRKIHSARYESLNITIVGCNMTMRRTLADRVGFFDERFGPGTTLPGGDDTDYTFRAYLAGLTIEYVPDMVVYHHHGRKRISDGDKLMRNYMIAGGALYAKYLFKHLDLCRPAYWDLKKAIREIITGKNNFRQQIGFSYKKLVAYNMLGAARYFAMSMRKQQA